MDKETFLASGLLEQHVLGLTDPNEEEVVAQYLERYPELREEVEDMRKAIEQYALQHAIPPPPGIKGKLLQEIDQKSAPSSSQTAATHGKITWLNIGVIAALALLCGLTALRMRSLQAENHTLQGQLITCESREKIIAFLRDPQTRPVMLEGTANTPSAAALVYWNEAKEEAMINPFSLKPLSSKEQYQIWADVDGKMLSVGLISENLEKYQELKYLPNATSLNITIEPQGGSAEPTVSRLVANHSI